MAAFPWLWWAVTVVVVYLVGWLWYSAIFRKCWHKAKNGGCGCGSDCACGCQEGKDCSCESGDNKKECSTEDKKGDKKECCSADKAEGMKKDGACCTKGGKRRCSCGALILQLIATAVWGFVLFALTAICPGVALWVVLAIVLWEMASIFFNVRGCCRAWSIIGIKLGHFVIISLIFIIVAMLLAGCCGGGACCM